MRRLSYLISFFWLGLILSSCGGDGGSEVGWIVIESYSAGQVTGTCFASPEGKRVVDQTCICNWAECIVNARCWDYVYEPRVHVDVTNQTTGVVYRAGIHHDPGSGSSDSYLWSADISLTVGDNNIFAEAMDLQGHYGNDLITIRVPPP